MQSKQIIKQLPDITVWCNPDEPRGEYVYTVMEGDEIACFGRGETGRAECLMWADKIQARVDAQKRLAA